MADREIGQSDTRPALDVTLEDDSGPVDLTGATVSLTMTLLDGTPVFTGRACTLGAAVGEVIYQWQTGDTATAGLHLAQWKVVDVLGKVWHFPNAGRYTVDVRPLIG